MRSSLVLALMLASLARAENVPVRLPPADVVSFDDAVKMAVTRNPTVQVAVEEIARARALVEETRASALPQLSANAAYTAIEGDRRAAPTPTMPLGSILVPADQLNANLSLV